MIRARFGVESGPRIPARVGGVLSGIGCNGAVVVERAPRPGVSVELAHSEATTGSQPAERVGNPPRQARHVVEGQHMAVAGGERLDDRSMMSSALLPGAATV